MEAQSKFTSMLAEHYLKDQVETKGLISKRQIVRLGPLITVGGIIFELGAVLGRALKDRLATFAYPFCSETAENQELADHMRRQGQEVASRTSDASSITELVVIFEMHKADPELRADQWSSWLLSEGNRELPIDFAGQMGMMFGLNGAGFGAEFPERLEELYVNSYAHIDPEEWRRAVAAGLEISAKPPEYVPLDERTEADLTMFAEYCVEFYPD